MADLSGKRAVVTGGTKGIGRAICERLIADGARVLTCGRSQSGAAAGCEFVTADVATTEGVETVIGAAQSRLGGIDILVNNAGIQIEKTVEAMSDDELDRLMGVNCGAVFRMSRAAIPFLRDAGGGVILNIGSISADHADPQMAAYNASKGFVHALTRSIAVDHGADGIRCNAVCPGWIMTEMAGAAFDLADDPAAAERDAVTRTPAGRMGRPEDIAAAISFLSGDDAAFITGQCYVVDGGLTAATPLRPNLF